MSGKKKGAVAPVVANKFLVRNQDSSQARVIFIKVNLTE